MREAVRALLTAAAAAALALLLLCAAPARGMLFNETTVVNLQMLNGLTTYTAEGTRVALGTSNKALLVAKLLATEHCNARNGSIVTALGADAMAGCAPISFRPSSWDTRSLPSVAVKAYLAAYNDWTLGRQHVVLGPPRSVAALPVSILASANAVPVISEWATSEALDDKAIHDYFLRSIPSDRATAILLARLLQGYGLRNVGMIYNDDSYGSGYREAVLDEVTALGIVLHSFPFRERDAQSIGSALDALQARGLNVNIVVAFESDAAVLLRGLRARGLTGPGRLLMFSDGISADELESVLAHSPELADALNGSQTLRAVGGDDAHAAFRRLRAAWPGVAARAADWARFLPGGANASAAAAAADDELAGGDLNVSLTEAELLQGGVLEDLAYAYDAVAAACRAACMTYSAWAANVGDGMRQDAGIGAAEADGQAPWTVPAWLRGRALRDVMRGDAAFPFEGTSGMVRFAADTGSRDPSTALFKLRNLMVDTSSDGEGARVLVREVGRWDGAQWVLSPDLVFPPGNEASPPSQTDIPPHDRNLLSQGVRIGGCTMAAANLLLCGAFAAWILSHRNAPVVRKAQPELLLDFLAGVAITCAGVLPSAVHNGDADGETSGADAACVATLWLLSTGTTVAVTALVLKLYRIFRIVRNPTFRAVRLRAAHLRCALLGALAVNALLLAVPTAVSPIHWRREVLQEDAYGYPQVSYGECVLGGGGVSLGFMVTLLLFHVSLYAAGAYFALRVRDVHGDYQEGRYLAAAVVFQGQLYLLAAPVYLAVGPENTDLRFFVLALAIFLGNALATLLVVLPKVWAQRADEARARRDAAAVNLHSQQPKLLLLHQQQLQQQQMQQMQTHQQEQPGSPAEYGAGSLSSSSSPQVAKTADASYGKWHHLQRRPPGNERAPLSAPATSLRFAARDAADQADELLDHGEMPSSATDSEAATDSPERVVGLV